MLTDTSSQADQRSPVTESQPERPAPARPVSAAIAQTITLGLLFAMSASFGSLRKPAVSDPDIWWHLRTGDVIFSSHAIPAADTFSRSVANHPWHAYSWLFDLLVSALFRHFGLPGIVSYTAGMLLCITVAVFALIRLQQEDFMVAAALTFAAMFSMYHLVSPRPWLFTVLFFFVELIVLMRARMSRDMRVLLWLPPLFALWANIHIQFIDGLVVLAFAVIESFFTRSRKAYSPRTRLPWITGIFVACASATLVNPYGWRLYRDAYDLSSQSGVLSKINELQAIPFRDGIDFAILFLALASVAVLARRRSLPLFEALLLLFAIIVAFRSQRDVWVLAGAACIILSTVRFGGAQRSGRIGPIAQLTSVCVAVVVLFLSGRIFNVNQSHLAELTRKNLPVGAAELVQQHGIQGPLYNDFAWGGYLLWKLKMPVSIDGRAALYGDQRIDRSVASWSGQPNWATDPQLTSAGVVIGPVSAPLVQLLRTDPHFQLAYEDRIAAVFVPRNAAR
ncbi:MAG TPA: hypothetical protein VLI45_01190 [Acidobacteriaceae bacterium]|nr:hypothetical protein [Acidobacteriaceae bacterium]